MRKVFFWVHLTAGVAAGLVILVMSVTGALLALEPQVTRFAESAQRTVVPPVPRPERLGPEALAASVLRFRPEARPSAVTLDADPTAAAVVAMGREGVLHVDPYTGRVLGAGSPSTRAFFRSVTDWHRWLALSGDSRPTGKAVTGACNAAFLFLSLSGLYLWWPKQWSARFLRPIVWFQGGLSGKARDFNWHNAIGLWSAPVIFFLTLTGLVISYPAIGNWLYAQQPPPGGGGAPGGPARTETRAPRAEGERREEKPLTPESFAGLDRAFALAKGRMPDWTLAVLRPPARADAPVSVTVTESASRSPFGRSSLTVDVKSGEIAKWEPFSGFATGRKLRNAARWTHTGEILSWPGQVVAGLASLGGAFLVWTGLALSWRRFRAWRAAGARRPEGVSSAAEPRRA
ncbi:MAG: PepSY-associated TM helix domain-containing protein [Vicinamibacteria bacterium]